MIQFSATSYVKTKDGNVWKITAEYDGVNLTVSSGDISVTSAIVVGGGRYNEAWTLPPHPVKAFSLINDSLVIWFPSLVQLLERMVENQ